MKRLVAVVICVLALCARGADSREWTDRSGRKFVATPVAVDAFRVTFALAGGAKAVVPIAQLSDADAKWIADWRKQGARLPMVDPAKLAPWPGQVAAGDVEVRVKSEEPQTPAFVYEGARFTIESDVKLPPGVIRDLNAVFEATRMALMALPLGILGGDEGRHYRVFFFDSPERYGRAGGRTASGGYYDGRHDRMLIFLPNLGIRSVGEKRTFDYQKNLFVLKHEVTHQLMRQWRESLPIWFSEGFAEVIAAVPYAQGRYTFSGMDSAIGAYVQKWRSAGDTKPMMVIPPASLMAISPRTWEESVGVQNAYDLYNSAALFCWFLLRHDGAGDGSPIAGFLDALRRGVSLEQATADFIRRGRTDEKLTEDFGAFLRRRGLKFEFEAAPGSR